MGLYLRVHYTSSWRAEGQHYILFFTLHVTAIEFSLGGSSPYSSTDATNKNKYT